MFSFLDVIVNSISSFFMASLIAVSGLVVRTPAITPTPTSTLTRTIIPTFTTIPTSTIQILQKTLPSNTPIPTYSNPQPTVTPVTQSDSATRIELCRANSEKQKANYIDAGANLLAQERPQIVELANTSNNEETERVALKYSYIKEMDIVRAADVYQKLINEGAQQDTAKSVADSTANTYWTYLRSLHDWAVKQIDDYKASIETKASNSKNDYYIKCLNNQR